MQLPTVLVPDKETQPGRKGCSNKALYLSLPVQHPPMLVNFKLRMQKCAAPAPSASLKGKEKSTLAFMYISAHVRVDARRCVGGPKQVCGGPHCGQCTVVHQPDHLAHAPPPSPSIPCKQKREGYQVAAVAERGQFVPEGAACNTSSREGATICVERQCRTSPGCTSEKDSRRRPHSVSCPTCCTSRFPRRSETARPS